MTHTPGPWKVPFPVDLPHTAGQVWHGLEDDPVSARMICAVGAGDTPIEVINANAHLIAAAPALLEAAKLYVAVWDEGKVWDGNVLAMFRAAIAQAEGKS